MASAAATSRRTVRALPEWRHSRAAVVLESGGPVLCSIHAAEVVPVADEDSEVEEAD